MKLSKMARTKKNLASAADKKSVIAAARKLLDFDLLSPARANLIARNYR